MQIRSYQPSDCEKLAALFYQTVHSVNASDYSPEQLAAWASGTVDLLRWDQSFRAHKTCVAVKCGEIVGFGDMDATGYLDRLYVHKDHQHEGIATAICNELEQSVNSSRFTTHASITAKPFFERRGYRILRKQEIVRMGVQLTNFVMEKQASGKERTVKK